MPSCLNSSYLWFLSCCFTFLKRWKNRKKMTRRGFNCTDNYIFLSLQMAWSHSQVARWQKRCKHNQIGGKCFCLRNAVHLCSVCFRIRIPLRDCQGESVHYSSSSGLQTPDSILQTPSFAHTSLFFCGDVSVSILKYQKLSVLYCSTLHNCKSTLKLIGGRGCSTDGSLTITP